MKIINFLFILFSLSCLNAFSIKKKYFNRKNVILNENKDTNLLSFFDYKILNFLRKQSYCKETIINKKENKAYNIHDLNYLKNKKTISVSPGGIQGFYFMGIVSYIKDNYDLSNVVFTGASAGAWISLFSSYKYSNTNLVKHMLDYDYNNIKSVLELQMYFKKQLLSKYTSTEFDLKNIFIGVTVLKGFELSTNIFYNFEDLEDAIDCCIASSHIPLLTGGVINKYNNEISFDGGFSNSPYLDINTTILHINPSLWSNNESEDLIDYNDLLITKAYNFTEMYNDGYKNANKNKNSLNKIFRI